MFINFLACSSSSLHVLYDGQDTERVVVDGRQLLNPAMVTLSLFNPSSTEIRIEELQGLEHINTDVEMPLVLSPMEINDISLQIDDSISGAYSFTAQFVGDFGSRKINLEGTIEPYIQYKHQDFPILDDAFVNEFEQQGLVGAAVGIVVGQEIVYMKGLGFSDREQEQSIDPRIHRFRWASLSKGLTAYVAMQQVEAGVLDLDTPISTLMAIDPGLKTTNSKNE